MKNKDNFFEKVEEYKYPSTILFRSIELYLIKEIFKNYLNKKPALDLGCGDGIATSLVFDRKIDYGLDNDKIALESSKKKEIFEKTIVGKGEEIDLSSKSLNLIFSNCTLEHIKDIVKVLKESRRVLKKNGYLIFTTPSNFYKKWSIFSFFRINFLANLYGKLRDRKFEHHNCYNLEEWESILDKFGFKIEKSFYYIDKKTMEFWDLLLISQNLLNRISKKLCIFIYQKYWKRQINELFYNAKTLNEGAGICIVAKKK